MRLLVGAYPRWIGCAPSAVQRIYFANHTSHMDTVVLWAALPGELRANTRPVAAKDYWDRGGIRGHIARNELNVVMIDRARDDPNADPLELLREALENGFSLIIFPEGTRTPQPLPGPFKQRACTTWRRRSRSVELIPVYIDNLHRSMPKGALLPVPIICTVRFGAPLARIEGEAKDALPRARARRRGGRAGRLNGATRHGAVAAARPSSRCFGGLVLLSAAATVARAPGWSRAPPTPSS
ncbi:MAG: 1-acyl-sn-glycerol-3-phosphate acyltransferase [Comamonadaceae bacterium]|nr:1-acyl-sn-glycerol-3-phosphate acyltransferase [Comamonadaceae bacterium]